MAENSILASEQWERYAYCRDSGHLHFVRKADKCDNFFIGNQWDPQDLASLRAARRPALTINKILITLSSIFGEQIQNRADITFRPRTGAPDGNAAILSKLWRYIADSNQFNWRREEVFSDGAITSRGFYDVRMNFAKNAAGDVEILTQNPKNVIIDPDAHEYDPDTWNDCFITKWLTGDDIALLYDKDAGKELAIRAESSWAYGYDSIDFHRNRFGGESTLGYLTTATDYGVRRNIRVLERQFRELARAKFFVDPKTGDRREIPADWDRNRIAHIAGLTGLLVTSDMAKKIRWRVTADNFVLHDEYSPYKHFTIIPYFPYFRHGQTVGLVENLIDPQELLNKVSSQELHVVNTTANSGWKTKTGNIKNYTADELEQVGAQTGLVLEVEDVAQTEKITPNAYPSGLDRISFKSEEHIKTISGRGDSQLGFDRADVAARATQTKLQVGSVNLLHPMSNLERTDWLLARCVLDYVTEYYTDQRTMTITKDNLTGAEEQFTINWPDPETGQIQGDISLGEYDIVVASAPAKATLENSQFEQGVALKELGVNIPEKFLIQNSNLMNKGDIVKAMEEQANSSQAKFQQQIEELNAKLTLANLKAETSKTEADATLKQAKAEKEIANTHKIAGELNQDPAQDPALIKAQQEMELKRQSQEQEMQMAREKHAMEMKMAQEKQAMDMQLQQQKSVEDARMKRAQAFLTARQQPPAKKPADRAQ